MPFHAYPKEKYIKCIVLHLKENFIHICLRKTRSINKISPRRLHITWLTSGTWLPQKMAINTFYMDGHDGKKLKFWRVVYIKSKCHFSAWVDGKYLRCLLVLKIKMNAVLTGINGVRVFFVSSYCVYFGIGVLVVFSFVLICKISF